MTHGPFVSRLRRAVQRERHLLLGLAVVAALWFAPMPDRLGTMFMAAQGGPAATSTGPTVPAGYQINALANITAPTGLAVGDSSAAFGSFVYVGSNVTDSI